MLNLEMWMFQKYLWKCRIEMRRISSHCHADNPKLIHILCPERISRYVGIRLSPDGLKKGMGSQNQKNFLTWISCARQLEIKENINLQMYQTLQKQIHTLIQLYYVATNHYLTSLMGFVFSCTNHLYLSFIHLIQSEYNSLFIEYGLDTLHWVGDYWYEAVDHYLDRMNLRDRLA